MSNPVRSVVRHVTEPRSETVAPGLAVRGVMLTIIAGAATMAVLYWAREVFIPIVLSILISYALEPIVVWLMRLRLPRALATTVVMASLTFGLGYVAWSLADDFSAMAAELPAAAAKLRTAMRDDPDEQGPIENVQKAAEELQKTADEAAGQNPASPGVQRVQVEEPALNVRAYISWGSASLIAFSGQLVLVFFFSFFLLASGDLFKRKLVKLAGPSLEKRKITVQILDEINTQIERFLLVRIFTSAVVGIASWLAFRAMGLQQAALWGLAAGVFNSIPYFGPVIVAAGTFIVAFLQFNTVAMGVYVSGVSVIITTLEGWLLTPWLTSRAARTNEVAMFVALIFWSFVWGLWGTLLAVPMLVAVKACCDRVADLKPIGELLGE